MATSGSKSVTVTSWDTLKFSWERSSYSITNNSSVISWKMELITGSSGRIDSSASKDWSVTVNGTKYSGTNKIGIGNNSSLTLASGSTTIKHNADGTKTFSYSFSQEFAINFSSGRIETKSGSGSGELDTIPRAATITSAPNFNDEANPTITYSNPAGNAVSSLRACISLTGASADIAYRDISKTGTSYTFNLTTAERNVLRAATTSSNSRSIRFYIETIIGDVTYREYISKTLTIVNASPTLTAAAVDTDSNIIALTGDANKLVKYFSDVRVTHTATALKSASIVDVTIKRGNEIARKVSTNSPKSYSNTEHNVFTVAATDSRGNTTSKTVTKTLVNYIKLTCNLAADAPSASGDMSFKISGNYFNGSFGAVNNTLTVEYRYKANDGDYSAWQALTPTISGNTYSATGSLTGLDYQSNYIFQARAQDKIYSGTIAQPVVSAEKKVKTTPVFDWGEDDFNFNVPVMLNYSGYSYSLLGLMRALTTTYEIPCTVTIGDNYTSATATAHLIGSSLRLGLTMKRNAVVNVGNVTNEVVMTINVNHGGKINNLYRVDFNSGTDGGAATFDVQASKVDDNNAKLTVTLCATTTAADSWNAYCVLPCSIVTKAYL